MRLKINSSQLLLTLLVALQILTQHKVLAEGEPCNKTPNNGQGICINMRGCAPYIAILQKHGAAAGDFLRSTLCYYSGEDPVVCCPNGAAFKTTPPEVQTPAPTPATTPEPFIPMSETNTNLTYGPLFAPQCGFSDTKHSRVVGGNDAERGAWPWIAVLGYKNKKTPNQPKWLCGGSLISARHILTAGHCVYNRYDLYLARLGEHDLNNNNDGANPIDVPIQKGVIHPGYSAVNYVNDIAVLKLRHDVTFTPAIHPICLPLPSDIKNRDYVRNFPFVAGWGSLYFHGPSANILQEVQLPVVSNEACAKAFEPFKNQVIDKRVMCAGYTTGGKDACQGDSGGALMFPKGNTYYAIGVVSFGFRCAEAGFPGVYTRVTHFLDFILANLN